MHFTEVFYGDTHGFCLHTAERPIFALKPTREENNQPSRYSKRGGKPSFSGPVREGCEAGLVTQATSLEDSGSTG